MTSAHPRPDEFPQVPEVLSGFRPRAALVLGSGLGGFADACVKLFEVSYADIPGLPQSKVPGHAGKYIGAELGGVPLLLALGRVHYYEGHSAGQVASHVRLMATLGPELLVLTNAAGTLHPDFAPGEWMMISDHLNLTAVSPLARMFASMVSTASRTRVSSASVSRAARLMYSMDRSPGSIEILWAAHGDRRVRAFHPGSPQGSRPFHEIPNF